VLDDSVYHGVLFKLQKNMLISYWERNDKLEHEVNERSNHEEFEINLNEKKTTSDRTKSIRRDKPTDTKLRFLEVILRLLRARKKGELGSFVLGP